MAPSRPLLSAEDRQRIGVEFQSIELECEKLAAFLTEAGAALPPSDSQDYWMQTRVCAAAAENIYTGLERVMAKLVVLLDGESVAHQDGWHKTLLHRLSGPFGGREAVISTQTHELLDRLRSFRHRVRSSYAIQLDLAIVQERCRDAILVATMAKADINSLLSGQMNDG